MKERPKKLYRGFDIRPNDLSRDIFDQAHTPMESSGIDGERRTDGNEVGVYMSTNPAMVICAYGNGISANSKIDAKRHNTSRGFQDRLLLPGIGIILEIDTEGLDIRKPKTPMGHYNNGFIGDEWITDKLEATHYRPIRFQVPLPSNRHRGLILDFDGNESPELDSAMAKVNEHYQDVLRETQRKVDEIGILTEKQRGNPFRIERILSSVS
jgi:hypothetical protein